MKIWEQQMIKADSYYKSSRNILTYAYLNFPGHSALLGCIPECPGIFKKAYVKIFIEDL